jgi:hypothetical protein
MHSSEEAGTIRCYMSIRSDGSTSSLVSWFEKRCVKDVLLVRLSSCAGSVPSDSCACDAAVLFRGGAAAGG